MQGSLQRQQHLFLFKSPTSCLTTHASDPPASRTPTGSARQTVIFGETLTSGKRESRQRSLLVAAAAAGGIRPTILVSEKLGEPGLKLLESFGTVDKSYNLTPEQLCGKVADADALIIRSATQVTKEVFAAAKGRLKVVGRAGVGVDNVDLQAATESGCLVVNAPTANTVAAAEHGIALIAALSRNVAQADASVKAGKWERTKFVGVSIIGKTLAIMGFGKVGSEVARRAKGMGFEEIIAYDPYASAAKASSLGVRLVGFDEALGTADFFSLHMPLTPDTKGIFDDAAFAKMKKGARIVNVARGGVIDDESLVRALDSGVVAQAALDVFAKEPPTGNPLVGRDDVVCTPHLGASTKEAQEDVAVEIAEAVVDALQGKLAATAVNAPMVPAEVLAELQPFVSLAQGLGRAAVQLVAETGFSDVNVTYASPRGDDLDTRLLRAMVIKGLLEAITTSNVNLVNADLLAQSRGLRIIESTVPSTGKVGRALNEGAVQAILSSLKVVLGTSKTKFSAALNSNGSISVEGVVKNGKDAFITRVGRFDVDLSVDGIVILVRQSDRPGIIAGVANRLAEGGVNVSYMTVTRTGRGQEAIMAIGIDGTPSSAVLEKIPSVPGIIEFTVFSEKGMRPLA